MLFVALAAGSAAPAGATVLHVDAAAAGANDGSNWTDAYTSLNPALVAAENADGAVAEIWVAQGVYKPAGPGAPRTSTFLLVNGVAVYGGFGGVNSTRYPGGETARSQRDPRENVTILSGDLAGDDQFPFINNIENCYRVVTASATGPGARLDGFTITGGYGSGGGLHHSGGTSTVANCLFIANGPGGAVYTASGDLTLINCTLLGNVASAGGGVFASSGTLTMVNCVLDGNRASYGGGLYTRTSATLINCTLVRNIPNGIGGDATTSSVNVSNSILWDNRNFAGTANYTTQIYLYYGGVTTSYSCIQGWIPANGGVGNIASDPLFIDLLGPDGLPGTPDHHLGLLSGSPCADAGNNDAVPSDIWDLDEDGDLTEPLPLDLLGRPRFQDDPAAPDTGSGTPPLVSMGAYEGPTPYFVLSESMVGVPEGGTASFTVALALDPDGPLEVKVARVRGDEDIFVQGGSTLSFDSSNYAVPQTVILGASPDPGFTNDVAVIRISASGVLPAEVITTEVDSDPVPARLYVNASADGLDTGLTWSDAFRLLSDALAAAAQRPGVSEIWIAEGLYKPVGPFTNGTFQLLNGVAVYGGFAGDETSVDARDPVAHETILTGDLLGNDGPDAPSRYDNAYRVVTGTGTDETAVLDAVTITAAQYSGLWNEYGHPTIRNCVFRANRGIVGGGMYNRNSNPLVTRCRFVGNIGSEYGGGMANESSSPIVRDCVFIGNTTHAGGGGIYNRASSSPEIINCVVSGNLASYWGAGIYNESNSHPVLVNCTIASNWTTFSLGDGGGVMSRSDAGLTLVNSILWANGGSSEAAQLSFPNTPANAVNYSCVQGWTGNLGGTGNIGANPLFIDLFGPDGVAGTEDDDLRLRPGSPVIDAGNSDALPEDVMLDFAGHRRLLDDPDTPDTGAGGPPVVDMGAYEYVPSFPGDLNGDGFVDFRDVLLFHACRTGPNIPYDPAGLGGDCAIWPDGGGHPVDFDLDGDVDHDDFGVLQRCLKGSKEHPDPACTG